MITSVYGSDGVGKTTLAKALAKNFNLSLISLDPQDGGYLQNAAASEMAPYSIIDCAPYEEYALSSLGSANQMIYILKPTQEHFLADYFKLVIFELGKFKEYREDLTVYFQFGQPELGWNDSKKQLFIRHFENIDWIVFGLPQAF